MDEYKNLLALLNGIEDDLQRELSALINQFRDTVRDMVDTLDRSLLVAAIADSANQFRLRASQIIAQYTARMFSATELFLSSQDVELNTDTGTRINLFTQSALQWVGAMIGLITGVILNENVDINKALFSKSASIETGVSAFSKAENSMNRGTQLAIFTTVNAIIFDSYKREQDRVDVKLRKMAIAVIDTRTTKTCKAVNGQSVFIEDRFILRNRPRFSRRMYMPPFHWNCRTSAIIVRSIREERILQSQIIGE